MKFNLASFQTELTVKKTQFSGFLLLFWGITTPNWLIHELKNEMSKK